MHKLITGLFYPQLQHAFIDIVESCRPLNELRPLLVVTRSDLLACHLQRLLNRSLPQRLGISLLTLKQMAEKISTGNSFQAIYQLNAPLQEALVLKISKQRVAPEDRFSRLLAMPGFARSLAQTIDELKNAAISARKLRELADAWDNPKLQTLAEIYLAYDRYLKSKSLYDDADILQQAGAVYHNRRWPGEQPLLLYGFWKLSLLERRLLKKLFEPRQVYAFIPFAAPAVFRPVLPLLKWFEQHGFERHDLGAKAEMPPQLLKLRQVMSNGANEAPNTEKQLRPGTTADGKSIINAADHAAYCPAESEASGVVLVSVSDQCQESQVLAREIMNLITAGYRFQDIAIFLAPGSYSGYVAGTLAGRDIPFSLTGAPLNLTREAQMALAMLQVFASDFSRHSISCLAYLLSAVPPGLVGTVWPAEWAKLAQDTGINVGVHQWLRQLQKFIDNCLEQETSAKKRNRDVEPLSITIRWRKMAESLLAFIQFLDDCYRRLQRSPSYRDFIDSFLTFYNGICPISAERRQVEQALAPLSHLDLLAIAPTIAEFLAMARQALRTSRQQATIACSQVWGGELTAAVGVVFPVMILPGMTEKEFTIIVRQVSLLQDRERARINRQLLTDLAYGSDRSAEEKLLYHLTITAASQRLYLFYSRIDTASNKPKLPASLLMETAAMILGHPVNYYSLETCGLLRHSSIDFYLNQQPTAAAWPLIYDLASLGQLLTTGNQIPTALAQQYPFFAITQENLRRRWQQNTFSRFDGIIAATGLRNLLREHYSPCVQPAVASRLLETYAVCPLRFFMKYVLGLAPARPVSLLPTVSYRQQQQIVVDILAAVASRSAMAEAAYNGHNQGNPGSSAASSNDLGRKTTPNSENSNSESRRRLPPFLQECAQATFARHHPEVEKMLWEVEQEKVLEKLAYYLQTRREDSPFTPRCFKLAYGESTGSGPTLALDEQRAIHFAGYFDQINADAGQQHVEGIHYLVDRLPSSCQDNRFYGGEQLQLAIDVLALAGLFPEYQVWRSAYRYLDDSGLAKEASFYGSHQTRTRERLALISRLIVTGIETGMFFPFPGRQKCRVCPYLQSCGANRQQIFDYKQDDPRIEFFRQLKQLE